MIRTARHISPSIRSRRGFTLVEIMVGLVVSTFVIGAAAAVFVTTLQSWQRGGHVQKLLHNAQTTGDLIERHLRSALSPNDGGPTGGGLIVFEGLDLSEGENHGHDIIFMSSAPSRFPRSAQRTDMNEVEFSFDPASGEAMTMRIDSSPDDLPEEGGYRAPLSTFVKSFQVVYFDGTDWVEEWTDTVLPHAVEFRLTFADPDEAASPGGGKTFQVSRLISMPTVKPVDPAAADTSTQTQTSGGASTQ